MGPSLRLLKRTPNNVSNVGTFREKYIVNPEATTETEMELLKFLGWLIGMGIASDNILSLNISHFTWKQLLNDPIQLDDLYGVDYYSYKELKRMQSYVAKPDEFDATFEEYFIKKCSESKIIELKPNGKQIRVTAKNLQEYIDLFVDVHKKEAKKQIIQIRKGICEIIPETVLMKLSAEDIDNKVCGRPNISIEQLKKITRYGSYSETDFVIQNFWKVMEEFTNDERSLYLKFVWGRSRLPAMTASMSTECVHKINKSSQSDEGLPVSHTCFFTIDLPPYSTIDIMRSKLLYAIQSCSTFEMG
jgi:E3 ubiquitin-protein ligase HERC1